jgi:hypothetical protein
MRQCTKFYRQLKNMPDETRVFVVGCVFEIGTARAKPKFNWASAD